MFRNHSALLSEVADSPPPDSPTPFTDSIPYCATILCGAGTEPRASHTGQALYHWIYNVFILGSDIEFFFLPDTIYMKKRKKFSERNGGFGVIHQLIVPFYQTVTVKIKRSTSQDCSMHQVLSSIPESHVYTKKY